MWKIANSQIKGATFFGFVDIGKHSNSQLFQGSYSVVLSYIIHFL